MKRISLGLLLISLSVASFAQKASQPPLPNAREGYYIQDGGKHSVWILPQNEKDNVKMVIIPLQDGYSVTTVLTPDQISEYGLDGDETRYISACVDTKEDGGWYFFKFLMEMDDDSQIVYLPGKAAESKTDVYFHLEGDEITEIGTEKNPGPMFDFLSSTTGFEPADGRNVKYPKNLTKGEVKYYHTAYSAGNDKMFLRNRFGVTASAGTGWSVMHAWIPLYSMTAQQSESTGTDNILPRYGVNLSAGAYLRIAMGNMCHFSPELIYSYTHNKGVLPAVHVVRHADLDIRFSAHTVRVPLLLRISNDKSKSNLIPYGEFGPMIQYSFTNCRYDRHISYDNYRRDKLSDSFWGLGVMAGAGVEYHINARQVASFGVRGTLAFKDVKPFRVQQNTIEFVAGFSIFNL